MLCVFFSFSVFLNSLSHPQAIYDKTAGQETLHFQLMQTRRHLQTRRKAFHWQAQASLPHLLLRDNYFSDIQNTCHSSKRL